MSQHPTIEELTRWRRGTVGEEQVLAIGRHLATCSQCVTQATLRFGLDEKARALCDDIEGDDEHPDLESDLFAFVNGAATYDQRTEIDQHLALCVSCSETVADLRSMGVQRGQPRNRRWQFAIAAMMAITVVTALMWPRRVSPPPLMRVERTVSIPAKPTPIQARPPTAHTHNEWDQLLEDTRNGSRISIPPALRSMRPEEDQLRGNAKASQAFSPSGVVVTQARPMMHWPAPRGAQSVVQIFRDEEEVARSPVLVSSNWRPERNLARGVTYTWQVRVTQSGDTQILPSSPTPVAQFRVLEAATLDELESAERERPGDHLLLGILHARAGLEAEAGVHLLQVTDRRDLAVARRILRELKSWKTEG